MALHAKVRTDNMTGTHFGGDLVSFKYQPSSTDTAIENGNFVKVGALIKGEREVRKAEKPMRNTPLKEIALVASDEVDATKSQNGLGDFINPAGAICKGYRIVRGFFSVTKEALDNASSVAVGDFIELKDNQTKAAVKKSEATGGSTVIGKVYAIEGEWIVIEIA